MKFIILYILIKMNSNEPAHINQQSNCLVSRLHQLHQLITLSTFYQSLKWMINRENFSLSLPKQKMQLFQVINVISQLSTFNLCIYLVSAAAYQVDLQAFQTILIKSLCIDSTKISQTAYSLTRLRFFKERLFTLMIIYKIHLTTPKAVQLKQ